jgi:hypothetical protein
VYTQALLPRILALASCEISLHTHDLLLWRVDVIYLLYLLTASAPFLRRGCDLRMGGIEQVYNSQGPRSAPRSAVALHCHCNSACLS